MDYAALRQEITADPLALGYSGMTDANAAVKLNAFDTGRTLSRRVIGKNELMTAISDSEWPTTAILQHKLSILFACDTIDASNANVRGVFAAIFPAGATRTALLALATRVVSRADELGLGTVQAADVALVRAKAGGW